METEGDEILDLDNAYSNYERSLVRPAGADPGTCVSFNFDIFNIAPHGDTQSLALYVDRNGHDFAGISFFVDGDNLGQRVDLNPIIAGQKATYRFNICPSEDEDRTFAAHKEGAIDEDFHAEGGVYKDLVIRVASACELDDDPKKLFIRDKDDKTQCFCDGESPYLYTGDGDAPDEAEKGLMDPLGECPLGPDSNACSIALFPTIFDGAVENSEPFHPHTLRTHTLQRRSVFSLSVLIKRGNDNRERTRLSSIGIVAAGGRVSRTGNEHIRI